MPKTLAAAVIQLCARQQVEENLALAEALTVEASRQGAELVILPENFTYIGRLEDKLKLAEPLSADSPGPILTRMITLARRQGVYLLLGGIPIASDQPSRFYNTAILLAPDGTILSTYRKIHLFDVNIPGGAVFTESEHVVAGHEPVVVPVLGATLGLSICYDLRFPELYRQLAALGATIVAVPAAFTLHTGKDHWFPLLRARAIENQVYVLAAGQHGRHTGHRTSYGKSCIIDPWGTIIAQVSDGDGVATARLDLKYVTRVRAELPCLQHRRLGVE